MSRYTKREKVFINSIIRIVLSVIMITVSILIFYNIVVTIINYPYLSNINIKKENPSVSFTIDNNMEDSFFITDDRGIRYRKEDMSFAMDEWIDKNGELFYFDNTSFGKEGQLRYGGQIYHFERGKLVKIERDRNYDDFVNEDLLGSKDSPQYLAYLSEDDKDPNGNYAIKYKRYSDNIEDYLGTVNDKQYCALGLLNINVNNIYFLSLGRGEKNGQLSRMRPNAQKKEIIGNNVEGYIALSDEIVYYYNGNIVVKAKTWTTVNVKFLNEENEFEDLMNSTPISDFGSNVLVPMPTGEVITPIGVSTGSNINSMAPIISYEIDEPIESESVNIGVAPGEENEAIVPIIDALPR